MRALALLALILSLGARAAPAPLVVEAELLPARVYVGGEARLRLRALRAPGIPHGVLRPPVLGEAAELSLVGTIDTYQAERGGVIYEVLERTHVIVPKHAGRLVVPGAEFESVLRYAETFQRDPRASLGPLTVRGPELALEVRAVPAGAGEPWLPARALTLEETWSRDLDALAQGTPVTRTLVLRAEGLAAERLPQLEMQAHPALVVHHDQPGLFTEYLASGMVGRRVQRIVLMPIGVGEVAVPELRVRWWDVQADLERVASLGGRTLRLEAAIAPAAAVPETQDVTPQQVLRGVSASIVFVSVLVLGWHLRTQARREARRNLRAACRRNDARGARNALKEWANVVGAAPVLDPAQMAALDAALYAGRAWDGKAFWRAARRRLAKPKARRRAAPKTPLPPFYRLQAPRT